MVRAGALAWGPGAGGLHAAGPAAAPRQRGEAAIGEGEGLPPAQ